MKICLSLVAVVSFSCFSVPIAAQSALPAQLAGFRSDLDNSTNQVINIVAIGDSETYGTGASAPANSWLQKLTAQLQAEFGNGGTGIIPLFDNVAEEATTGNTLYKWVLNGPGWRGGVPAIGPNSPKQSYPKYSLYYGPSDNANLTATLPNIPNVYGFCIYFVTYLNTSQGITYSIDGGGQALLNGSNTITRRLIPGKSCVLAPDGFGTHTLTLWAPSTGQMFLFGAEGISGTTGVRVHNLAYAGSDTYFAGHDTESQLAPFIGLIGNISLVLDGYGGENDWQQSPEYKPATYATYLQNSISYFQELYPAPSILLVGETNDEYAARNPNGFGTQAAYQGAQQGVGEANPSVAFFSIAELLGDWETANANGYMYDHAHPNDAGQALIAKRLYSFIFGD